MLSEEQLTTIFTTEFGQSIGATDDGLAEKRQIAMDRYLGEPLGNEVEGESQVLTSDVSDVVDGVLPSLLRIFTTADNLVSFDPVGPEDVAAAEQETDYVSHVFFKKNNAFMILFTWFLDALLLKNGYVMAWWDESEKVSEETYDDKSLETIAELLDDPELEPIERSENDDGTHNIKFQRVTKSGRVAVESFPCEEFRISSDANGLDPGNARLVGRERMVCRSDMIDMGFDEDQVKALAAWPATTGRKAGDKNRKDQPVTQPQDKSQELIQLREGYMKVDFNEDGRAELRQIFTGNGDLMKWKDGEMANLVVDRQPYHVLCPWPLPHKHIGRSWAERVVDDNVTTTTLLRGAINNLYHTNNPGHGVWEQGMSENTLDDLLSTKVGSVRRFARPPQESYISMAVPFTAGATFPVLEYFGKTKRDRTGIGSDSEGLSPDALKNIQTTVMAQSVDLSKMKIEAIARVFAETGLKTLFLHIHEMVLKHQKQPDIARLRNQFVTVDPREWRARQDMTAQIGLGIGTREQNLLHLEAISQRQAQQVAGGGLNLTVTPKNIWETNKEYVKNANLKDPALYFTDPGDKLAPPPADEQMAFEKEKAELEKRRQQLDSDRNKINIARVDLEREKLELTHQREIAKLEEVREAREDKFAIQNEGLRNEIAKLQMAANEQPLVAAKTMAEIQLIRADTGLKKATAAKVVEEGRSQDIENDAAETGLLELVEALNGDQGTETN